MADSDKGNSPTVESKAKMSLLDDDFSKDFLSSWKSNGDDMDFNFEPVSKGKKKAFEFAMDMDFSLDDAFGKMPSFKMDMEDFDFSSSPKKTTKSKEKSEEDSSKGNCSNKHDKFNFSFDFNGLDDFSLDVPSNRDGKGPHTEKKISECDDFPKQVTDDKKKATEDIIGLDVPSNREGKSPNTEKTISECEDFSKEVADNKKATEDIISKGMSKCEDAASSKSDDVMIGNGDPDTTSNNSATKSTLLAHHAQLKESAISFDMKFAEDIQKNDRQIYQEKESTVKISCSPVEDNPVVADVTKPSQSSDSPMVVDSAELLMNTDHEMQLKEDRTSNQILVQAEEMDVSAKNPLDESLTQVNIIEDVKISSSVKEAKDGSSEDGNIIREVPAAVVLTSDPENLIMDKSSLQCSIEKMNINDEKDELGNGGCLGTAMLPLSTDKHSAVNDTNALPSGVRSTDKHSAVNDTNTLPSGVRSTAGVQKPTLKVSSVPFRSGPNATNPITLRNKVQGATNLNFPSVQAKNDGRMGSSANDIGGGSTHTGSLDKSCGDNTHIGNILDDNQSSCRKDLMKNYSLLEDTEKKPSAHTIRNDVSADSMRNNRKPDKDGLPSSLEVEKMINNDKSSGKEYVKKDEVLLKIGKNPPAHTTPRNDAIADSMRHNKNLAKDGLPSLESESMTNNGSSSSKELIKIYSNTVKIEKNPSAHTTPSTVNGKNRNDESAGSMRHNRKSVRVGLPSLESEKMIHNDKSSGTKLQSSAPSVQGTKFSNQGQGVLKKPSSAVSTQKLNIGLGNELLSPRINNKMHALPGLKRTSSTIADKRPATPNVKAYVKSPGEFGNSSRLQSSIKTVSPVFVEKRTASFPSLKRKPPEAADMDSANLRMPKRASPSERSMSTVSPRNLEDKVQSQETSGSGKNVATECLTPDFNFDREEKMEALQFSLTVDNDANVEKAEACAKELDNIYNMLKKKHEEAKELLVRALVNNNNLLMLNHPIYDDKIRAVQRFASRLMSKEPEVDASKMMSKELEVEA